ASARWLTVGSLAAAAALGILGGWSSLKDRLARPDFRFATGMDAGTNSFTLLIRTQVPAEPDEVWRRFVGLAPVGRASHNALHFAVYLTPKGAVLAQRFGQATTNFAYLLTSNQVLQAAAGRSALLSVTRRQGLQLHLDGQPLVATLYSKGVPTNWLDYLSTRYAIIGDPLVSEIALTDVSLTDDELRAAAALGSLSAVEELLARPSDPHDPTATNDVPSLQPAEGVTLEPGRRPTDPQTPWLVLRRGSADGPLALSQALHPSEASRLRGPLRLAAQVWNPNDFPVQVTARIDDGPAVDEVIEARSDASLLLICRAPHPNPAERLDLRFSHAESAGDDTLPSGTSVFLRGVDLSPGATFVWRKLTPEIRFFDLADRMSGRNEAYDNAVQMLADYAPWGAGAGTFASLYQLYMKPGQDWAAYLHNDWLETRITLGTVGLVAVVAALLALAARSCFGSGLPAPRVVILMIWIGLAGCLAHARFDYPFQIYSIAFVFVLLASILLVLTARHRS
ncbi:MAG: hypothetical protein IT580_09985, partial [Verrucomicrobiales bacterium]|nr:hypothetical protein [Verrucomicrobiales bacterium]